MYYSALIQLVPQKAIYYVAISTLVAIYAVFAVALYPIHTSIHLYGVGEALRAALPAGLHGLATVVQVRGRGVWGVSSGGGGCVCLWVCLGMGVWKAKALDFPIPLPPLPIVHPNCAPPHSLPNAVPLPLPRLRAEPLDVVSRIRHT